jgi:hypothetical protein
MGGLFMKFQEVLDHLTGISTPIFGVSWNPLELDVTRAKRVIAYLEDRRVLYAPHQLEVPEHCVQSVLEIRHFLTEEIGSTDSNNELTQSLRAMRAACRKFMVSVSSDPHIIRHGAYTNSRDGWIFLSAIGELRGVFGIHLAIITAQHGLDIEDDLASILPIGTDDDKTTYDRRKG